MPTERLRPSAPVDPSRWQCAPAKSTTDAWRSASPIDGTHDVPAGVVPAYGEGLVFWTQAYGSWGQYDGNGNAATVDRSLGGFVSGVDTGLHGNWRAGLATGYTRTDLSVGARASSSDVDSYLLAAYAGGPVGSFICARAQRGAGTASTRRAT